MDEPRKRFWELGVAEPPPAPSEPSDAIERQLLKAAKQAEKDRADRLGHMQYLILSNL